MYQLGELTEAESHMRTMRTSKAVMTHRQATKPAWTRTQSERCRQAESTLKKCYIILWSRAENMTAWRFLFPSRNHKERAFIAVTTIIMHTITFSFCSIFRFRFALVLLFGSSDVLYSVVTKLLYFNDQASAPVSQPVEIISSSRL